MNLKNSNGSLTGKIPLQNVFPVEPLQNANEGPSKKHTTLASQEHKGQITPEKNLGRMLEFRIKSKFSALTVSFQGSGKSLWSKMWSCRAALFVEHFQETPNSSAVENLSHFSTGAEECYYNV